MNIKKKVLTTEEKVLTNEKEFKRLCRNIYKFYYSSEGKSLKVNIKSSLIRNGGTRPCIIEYDKNNNELNVTLNSFCFYPDISWSNIYLAAYEVTACIRCITTGKNFNSENNKYYRTKDFRKIAKDLELTLKGNNQCLKVIGTPFMAGKGISIDCDFIKYEISEIKTNFQKKPEIQLPAKFSLSKNNEDISPIADRFNFKCPKCNQTAYSNNKVELVCGKCFVRMNMEVTQCNL